MKDLAHPLRCPQCRSSYPLKDCKRVLNFTTGEATFYCQNCRTKIALLTFAQWNALHRASLVTSPRSQNESRRERSRDRRRRRRY